ncbi:MAG: acyltransferase [Deltaproteobacteria bacterium]|nr:acyltransferase [Deltaproteobacteria bacterium]
MKIGFLQTRPVFGEIKKNTENAAGEIERLDCDLIVLPELFSTGYQFRNKAELLKLSEEIDGGYAVGRLKDIAKKKNMHIVAGLAEKEGRRAYNSSVLIGPKGVVGLYRKAHLFWDERKIFTPGDRPLSVHKAGRARVGMMICFDWVFPEVARTLALLGADIICQPSNLVLPYCPEAMKTRSLENRVFSITANRVGTEERVAGKRLKFIGSSQIVAPNGAVLYRAGGWRVEARVVEVDPRDARRKKITPLNDIIKDRRVDLFKLG